jgi:NAD(P)-dependent dehydrogenase (short-subunit alcohol dehydrogenase family)
MAIGIDLSGKVAIVTGAGRGIGRAVALSLAEAGADVCVTARTESQIEETADLIRRLGRSALAVSADATDALAVGRVIEKTLESLGGLHILVNNAGMELTKPLLDTSDEDYQRVMDTNVKSCFLFTRAAGSHLIAQRYGRIVTVGSVGGIAAGPKHAIYQMSKAAVMHFTKSMAIEWARHNITVNAVAPGWVRTQLIAHVLEDPKKLEDYLRPIPLRRLGEPEEIGRLVAYLSSDLASFMTGSVVVIDGGLLIP